MKKFVYGSFVYEYELIRQDRKTLSLTVKPDLHIIVKVPVKAEEERIQKFLKRKWFWLEKQLSLFKRYQRKTYLKEYISGEGFLYLGRQYTLLVKKSYQDNVRAFKGRMLVDSILGPSSTRYTKLLVERWYRNKKKKVFQERLLKNIRLFSYEFIPKLDIRNMKRRWGSFIKKETIILNPKLIHAATDCIDYVIIHELCHFKYRNHDKRFYKLLEEKYPKWEKVKDKLEMYKI